MKNFPISWFYSTQIRENVETGRNKFVHLKFWGNSHKQFGPMTFLSEESYREDVNKIFHWKLLLAEEGLVDALHW